MKRLRWKISGEVKFSRGNYMRLIAKFDNSRKWIENGAICTVQDFRSDVRKLAQVYGAKEVELKPLFDEDDKATEKRENVVQFLQLSSGYFFRIPLLRRDGEPIEYREFSEDEVFSRRGGESK